jgi:hypothetical protein
MSNTGVAETARRLGCSRVHIINVHEMEEEAP